MIIIAIIMLNYEPECTYCCALRINNLSAHMYMRMYIHMYTWHALSVLSTGNVQCVYRGICTLNVIYTGQMMRSQCKSYTLRTQTFVDKHTHTHTHSSLAF